MKGLGCRVPGIRLIALGTGCRVWDLVFSELRVNGVKCRVYGVGCKV